jgi:hypothetical protein
MSSIVKWNQAHSKVTTLHLNHLPTKPLFSSLIKQEITGTPDQKLQTIQFSQLPHRLTRSFKPFPTQSLIALLIKQEITGKSSEKNKTFVFPSHPIYSS